MLYSCTRYHVLNSIYFPCLPVFDLFVFYSETAERRRFETKADEGAKVIGDKEAAVERVDQLTVQAKAQGDSYDALVCVCVVCVYVRVCICVARPVYCGRHSMILLSGVGSL